MTSLSNLIIGETSKFNAPNLVSRHSTKGLSNNSHIEKLIEKEEFLSELTVEENKKLIQEHKDNILSAIDELIGEIEAATESINEQAYEHINDGDNILTANQSNQIDEFLIVSIRILF